MQVALLESVACRKFSTHSAAARSLKLSAERGHQYRILARLNEEQQEQVLSGQVDQHWVTQRFKVASLQDVQEQGEAFAHLVKMHPQTRRA